MQIQSQKVLKPLKQNYKNKARIIEQVKSDIKNSSHSPILKSLFGVNLISSKDIENEQTNQYFEEMSNRIYTRKVQLKQMNLIKKRKKSITLSELSCSKRKKKQYYNTSNIYSKRKKTQAEMDELEKRLNKHVLEKRLEKLSNKNSAIGSKANSKMNSKKNIQVLSQSTKNCFNVNNIIDNNNKLRSLTSNINFKNEIYNDDKPIYTSIFVNNSNKCSSNLNRNGENSRNMLNINNVSNSGLLKHIELKNQVNNNSNYINNNINSNISYNDVFIKDTDSNDIAKIRNKINRNRNLSRYLSKENLILDHHSMNNLDNNIDNKSISNCNSSLSKMKNYTIVNNKIAHIVVSNSENNSSNPLIKNQKSTNKNIGMKYISQIKQNNSKSFKSLENGISTLKTNTLGTQLGPISRFIFEEDTNFFSGISFESTKKVEFLNEKLKVNSFVQFLFSLLSLSAGIMQYTLEKEHIKELNNNNHSNNSNSDDFSQKIITDKYLIAEWFCFLNTIGLLFTFFTEYYINCEMDFLLKKLPQIVWLLSFEKIIITIINGFVFIWHPTPLFHNQVTTLYNSKFKFNQELTVNSLLFSLLLFRFWFVFKLLVDFSEYSSARTKRVCRMNNFNVNFSFCIKSLMESQPYHVYGILLSLCIVVCTFMLNIYESGLDDISGFNFSSYWNCVWCTIITMTTVGFGDMYPSSMIGRIIGLICSFIGVFLMSMLVVTITTVLNLDQHEKNFYMITEKVDLENEKINISRNLISDYLVLNKMFKKEANKGIKANKEFLNKRKYKFLYNFFLLQSNKNKVDNTFPPYSIFDAITEDLNFLEEEVVDMESKQNNTTEILDRIISKLKIT